MFLEPIRFLAKLLTTPLSIRPEMVRTGPIQPLPPKPVICWEPVFRKDTFDTGAQARPGNHDPRDLSHYQDEAARPDQPPTPPAKHDPFDLSHYGDQQ